MGKKDQQEWYRKFNEGTFLIQGWKSRKRELLKGILSREQDEMEKLLDNLGKKIGMEWAKENETRKIDNSKLQQWGKELQKAKRSGPDALAVQIRQLNTEVDNLLAG